tara:strand:+ start:1027 stop:1359 length:333 start_codon:yes stop_codon:yes gene_type:complete
LIIIGEINELIISAGSVDSIPAISIHSPCRLVVLRPKYSFEVDHHANTGVENPIIHAGNAINKNSNTVEKLIPVISNGAINILDTITPMMKIIHNCLTLGISSGDVLCIK